VAPPARRLGLGAPIVPTPSRPADLGGFDIEFNVEPSKIGVPPEEVRPLLGLTDLAAAVSEAATPDAPPASGPLAASRPTPVPAAPVQRSTRPGTGPVGYAGPPVPVHPLSPSLQAPPQQTRPTLAAGFPVQRSTASPSTVDPPSPDPAPRPAVQRVVRTAPAEPVAAPEPVVMRIAHPVPVPAEVPMERVVVQRADDAAGASATPATATTTTATPAHASASHASAPGGGDPDELVKKIFDPLLRRLKAELLLDRDRRGALTDLRF
jgi:hypothetical protein